MTKKDIAKILMNRDSIDAKTAVNIIEDTQDQVNECLYHGGSYDEVEDVLHYNLGLEMDYVMAFI